MSNFETFGQVTGGIPGTAPAIFVASTVDSLATITASGYLNDLDDKVKLNDVMFINYLDTSVQPVGGGNANAAYLSDNFRVSVSGADVSLVLATDVITTSSATPGTLRAITGQVNATATTITSGNLVGVRGEVNMVGASGGFFYGAQGKVLPSGTLSGSSWTAGLFGQLDLSAATINAGQTAPVWADYGATGGTFTSVTGMRMFSGTNTIASLTLNAMDYRYGKASNLFELAGDAGTYILTGAATPSGTIKKIRISIDGVEYFLLAATVFS